MMGPLSDGLPNQTTVLMLVGRVSAKLSTILKESSFLDDCYFFKTILNGFSSKLFTGRE